MLPADFRPIKFTFPVELQVRGTSITWLDIIGFEEFGQHAK